MTPYVPGPLDQSRDFYIPHILSFSCGLLPMSYIRLDSSNADSLLEQRRYIATNDQFSDAVLQYLRQRLGFTEFDIVICTRVVLELHPLPIGRAYLWEVQPFSPLAATRAIERSPALNYYGCYLDKFGNGYIFECGYSKPIGVRSLVPFG